MIQQAKATPLGILQKCKKLCAKTLRQNPKTQCTKSVILSNQHLNVTSNLATRPPCSGVDCFPSPDGRLRVGHVDVCRRLARHHGACRRGSRRGGLLSHVPQNIKLCVEEQNRIGNAQL